MGEYTEEHSKSGLDAPLPRLEVWPNQFRGYEVLFEFPEFTSVCPRTGLPDFGTITLTYTPRELCLEMKSFKMYLQAYRNVGVFQENAVNRILEDVVSACHPLEAKVTGEFNARGGISGRVTVRFPRRTTVGLGEE